MSNTLAIAAVTSTLRYVLERALQVPHPGPVGGAAVTTFRPDRLSDPTLVTTPGINIYLYDVRPNHAWNLTDLPTRGRNGALVRRPVAALDLHYLLTCYGDDESLDAQRLLGRAVLALAVTPVLTRDVVAAAVATYAQDVPTAFLAEADLADQVDSVKIAPYTLSLEESAGLWDSFSASHQLSQTYLASAALVEADVTPRTALPVRTRTLSIEAGGPPVLTDLVTDPPGAPTATGGSVAVRGSGLLARGAGTTRVRIGPTALVPGSGASPLSLTVTLDETVPAGLHKVQVVHEAPPAGSTAARVVSTSNTLPLLVRPTVSVMPDGAGLVLAVSPPMVAGQRATVLLTRIDQPVAGQPDALTLRMAPLPRDAVPQDRLELPAGDVPSGRWLVRLRVDGVDSVPDLVGGTYGAPALTVP